MKRNRKRFAGLVAGGTLLLMTMVFLLSPSALATSSSGSVPPATSGDIEIVSYNTDLNLGNGDLRPASEIRPGTLVDILIKVVDTRPEVAAFVQENLTSCKPVAILNTSSFTRGRDMTSYSGYPDYRIELNNGNAVVPEDTDNDGKWNRITYVLRMPLKYTGNGNTFACNISYEHLNSVPMQTVSLTMSMCVDNEATSASTSTVTRGTGFVLKSASYGEGAIEAGSDFTLNATLLSTNGSYNVENVSVEVVPAKEFTLTNGSAIFYVGTVKPNQAIPVMFPLTASAVAEGGSYVVTINIKGVNANDGTAAEASMDISIPIVQPDRFEIGNAQVPDFLTAGMDDGMGFASVSLVNKGKGIVYNVSAEVVGDGLTTDEGNQFIGNIASGSENSADFNIHASTPGEVKAQIVVTYENSRGEEKTLTYDFTITVGEGGDMMPVDPFPVDSLPEEGGGGVPGWVWLLIGLVVVAGGTVTAVILVKKHKAKKAAALDDEDDDDETV